jgi:phosphopantetheine adenylyltransferase
MLKIIISGHKTEILNLAAWINMQHCILILCDAITQKQSDHQHDDCGSPY